MHASFRTAAPAIVAAVLLGGGSGMATLALAGDDSATRSGNEAPLDDNHGSGSPTPAAAPVATTAPVALLPTAAPATSPDDHGGDRPRPRSSASADDDATHDVGDDHGGDRPRPSASASVDDDPTEDAGDDHGGDSGSDSSGRGSDDGSGHDDGDDHSGKG